MMFNRLTRRKIVKKARAKLKDMLNDKGFRDWLIDYLFMVSKPEDLLALYNMYKAGFSPDHIEKVSKVAKEQEKNAGN
jgi:uncharacterized protein YcgL (UPF0745 family)